MVPVVRLFVLLPKRLVDERVRVVVSLELRAQAAVVAGLDLKDANLGTSKTVGRVASTPISGRSVSTPSSIQRARASTRLFRHTAHVGWHGAENNYGLKSPQNDVSKLLLLPHKVVKADIGKNVVAVDPLDGATNDRLRTCSVLDPGTPPDRK